MTPTATVIVVNYNGAHLLPECLDGLRRQTGDVAFSTVVVDNASSDGSVELLRRDYPEVTVITNPDNLGFAGGNNVALRQVRTPFAVLLNNDAVPEPDWLANLLATFSEPGNEDVAIATGKILFLPRFFQITLETDGFVPGNGDTRELGARIYRLLVDGRDVTERVMWEGAVYGPEGQGDERFRWSRRSGAFAVPIPANLTSADRLVAPVRIEVVVEAERVKPFTVTGPAGASTADEAVTATALLTSGARTIVTLEVPAGAAVFDVINNAGGQVFSEGSGADRGFQEVDRGQYQDEVEVFTACGNGMAMRTVVGQELGWFDDNFFMYYEDTDLSWRWRAAGWSIRYQPAAVLRHIHAASSKEWSPRWVFHVERNRMLMLTKNATPALAGHAVLGYARSLAGDSARAVRQLSRRQRPPLRGLQVKYQVAGSYLRLLPGALKARREQRAAAHVAPRDLQKWLVRR